MQAQQASVTNWEKMGQGGGRKGAHRGNHTESPHRQTKARATNEKKVRGERTVLLVPPGCRKSEGAADRGGKT